jgi:hypothetical protein
LLFVEEVTLGEACGMIASHIFIVVVVVVVPRAVD